jgi:hypothetical protein
MFTVPAVTPVTTPVAEPTVATEVLLLAHEPPAGEPAKVSVAPVHTVLPPVMEAPETTVNDQVAIDVPTA